MPRRRRVTDAQAAHVFAILRAGRLELMRRVQADVRRIRRSHPRVASETMRIANWLYAVRAPRGRRPVI